MPQRRQLRCLADQRPIRLEPAASPPSARPPLIDTFAAVLLIAIIVAGCGAVFTAIASASTPSCSCEVDRGDLR